MDAEYELSRLLMSDPIIRSHYLDMIKQREREIREIEVAKDFAPGVLDATFVKYLSILKKYVLQDQRLVTKRDSGGMNLFMYLMMNGNTEGALWLLEQTPYPFLIFNQRDSAGHSAFWWAQEHGQEETLAAVCLGISTEANLAHIDFAVVKEGILRIDMNAGLRLCLHLEIEDFNRELNLDGIDVEEVLKQHREIIYRRYLDPPSSDYFSKRLGVRYRKIIEYLQTMSAKVFSDPRVVADISLRTSKLLAQHIDFRKIEDPGLIGIDHNLIAFLRYLEIGDFSREPNLSGADVSVLLRDNWLFIFKICLGSPSRYYFSASLGERYCKIIEYLQTMSTKVFSDPRVVADISLRTSNLLKMLRCIDLNNIEHNDSLRAFLRYLERGDFSRKFVLDDTDVRDLLTRYEEIIYKRYLCEPGSYWFSDKLGEGYIHLVEYLRSTGRELGFITIFKKASFILAGAEFERFIEQTEAGGNYRPECLERITRLLHDAQGAYDVCEPSRLFWLESINEITEDHLFHRGLWHHPDFMYLQEFVQRLDNDGVASIMPFLGNTQRRFRMLQQILGIISNPEHSRQQIIEVVTSLMATIADDTLDSVWKSRIDRILERLQSHGPIASLELQPIMPM